MSWQGNTIAVVRQLIGDTDSTAYTYSDTRIEQTVLTAAMLVNTNTNFVNTYTIDIAGCSISPDPTDTDTKDDPFVALISLKAACIIVGSEVRKESGNAISIKDGPSAIDLRGVTDTLLKLYKNLCDKFEETLFQYRAGDSVAGQAILTPYSPGSDSFTSYSTDHRFQ